MLLVHGNGIVPRYTASWENLILGDVELRSSFYCSVMAGGTSERMKRVFVTPRWVRAWLSKHHFRHCTLPENAGQVKSGEAKPPRLLLLNEKYWSMRFRPNGQHYGEEKVKIKKVAKSVSTCPAASP